MMTSPSDFRLEHWAGRRFDIEERMYDKYEGNRDDSPHRGHLGASDIGNTCPRHVWYTYRHAFGKTFPPRLYKVFDTGHRAEPIIAEDMRRAGCRVETDIGDGKTQFAYRSFGGHVRVNLDGIAFIPDRVNPHPSVDGKNMIVEMKTMSLKRFKTLCAKGIQSACPEYYRQMQMQLLVAARQNQEFDGCFFIALCKDNDEYFTYEVDNDWGMQKALTEEVMDLLEGKVPAKLACSENSMPCRFCNYLQVCKQDRFDLIEKNCRTCDHAEMVVQQSNNEETSWRCTAGHDFGQTCDDWCMYVGF